MCCHIASNDGSSQALAFLHHISWITAWKWTYAARTTSTWKNWWLWKNTSKAPGLKRSGILRTKNAAPACQCTWEWSHTAANLLRLFGGHKHALETSHCGCIHCLTSPVRQKGLPCHNVTKCNQRNWTQKDSYTNKLPFGCHFHCLGWQFPTNRWCAASKGLNSFHDAIETASVAHLCWSNIGHIFSGPVHLRWQNCSCTEYKNPCTDISYKC